VGTVGLEAALVAARWSLQTEYLNYAVKGPPGEADPVFQGFYMMASFFITGEYRPYKITGGSFFRLHPHRSVGGETAGLGAIELAVRYGRLDLDAASEGNYGTEDQAAFGINWYLNPAIRMMGDLTVDRIDYPGITLGDGTVIPPFSGSATGVSFRFQVEF
jgi:phosphate-selective porin OprO/OprP